MLKTQRAAELFNEARKTGEDSLRRLDDSEKHWDRRELLRSAEQAWEAATQATGALILTLSGVEPEPNGKNDTYGMLSSLAIEVPELRPLKDKYTDMSVYLYDLVICNGSVDPLEFTIEAIRNTADYIRECQRLAGPGLG